MKYIVKDWEGNILGNNDYFDIPNEVVAMEFDSFEDAWTYMLDHHREENNGELEVVQS